MKRTPIDPEVLRDRLSVEQGKRYWQSLEELAGDPRVREMVEREFPSQAAEWNDPMSRRRFLTLMGASLALAGLAGCRAPTGTIMPYVRQPENLVLGKPLYYATAMTLGGFATGLLAESHEGRPTKLEGNPQHPASLGATTATQQAAVLGLYDPDRSKSVQFRGQPRPFGDAMDEIRLRIFPRAGLMDATRAARAKALDRVGGKGVAIVSETLGSPTLLAQRDTFLAAYPEARWFQYDAIHRDNAHAGARLAFGEPIHSYFRVEKADVIVCLDADMLGSGPTQLVDTRAFSSRRREAGGAAGMSRLYVFETDMTVTGAKADNRLAVRPSRIEPIARAIAARLGVAGGVAPPLETQEEQYVAAVAKDLTGRTGTTLIRVGDGQPPAVHALGHAINQKLGNLGQTVLFAAPLPASRSGSMAALRELVDAIDGGTIHTLLVLGGNPVATAPASVPLGDILTRRLEKPRKEWLAVALGQTFDETARVCHWHIPETHFLEQWGDGVAFDGTASVVQPLIAPLYGAKSAHEVIAGLTPISDTPGDYDGRSGMDLVRATWLKRHPEKFETFWQQSLHDGVLAETKWPTVAPTLRAGLMADAAMKPGPASGEGYELAIAPDPFVLDGRFANNGWLQETPRPITRLTWDNALMMSPATAKALGVATHVGGYKGGERGETIADVVKLEAGNGVLEEVAVWVVPGHADGAFTLHLGYGRTHAGKVGTGLGFDANRLRDTRAAWFLTGVTATRLAGKSYQMACLQGHYTMDGRDIVRSGTAEEYKRKPGFVTEHDHSPGVTHDASGKDKRTALPTLLPVDEYTGYKWGMAVDMTACTGCGACVVACQAENNVPVVGKEETTRGRQMQWLRIDRYFETTGKGQPGAPEPEDELRVHFMPLMCQHCEKAPCELVCPVEATVHGDEGTNDMVYNRCVGTRYCSNNCPYKVRRFNFLQYSDYDTPSLKLAYNPDVTVRSRGVMEKCTFCIQRIAYARIESAKELLDEQDYEASNGKPWPADRSRKDPNGRKDQGKDVAYIRDGEVRSACQSACPAEAIVFGDLNDAKSRVHAMHESELRYDLLGELGTRPRVGYLADLRNPNPALEAK